MTITQLNNKAIAVTGLPEGETPCHTYENTLSLRDIKSGTLCNAIKLPEGNWTILGRPADLSEDDWKRVVEIGMDYDKMGYFNYESDSSSVFKYPFETATESSHSLLEAKGLDPLLNHLILIQ